MARCRRRIGRLSGTGSVIDRRLVVAALLCAGLVVACGSAPTSPATDIGPTLVPIPSVATEEPPAPSKEPIAAAYEAVFLRLKVVDGSPEVLAIGVDPTGHERQIARLKDAWVAYKLQSGGGFLAPMGAVSPSGLLAIPVGDDLRTGPLPMVHWEIFDLQRASWSPDRRARDRGRPRAAGDGAIPLWPGRAERHLGHRRAPWHPVAQLRRTVLRRLVILRRAHRDRALGPTSPRTELSHARLRPAARSPSSTVASCGAIPMAAARSSCHPAESPSPAWHRTTRWSCTAAVCPRQPRPRA